MWSLMCAVAGKAFRGCFWDGLYKQVSLFHVHMYIVLPPLRCVCTCFVTERKFALGSLQTRLEHGVWKATTGSCFCSGCGQRVRPVVPTTRSGQRRSDVGVRVCLAPRFSG